jgi:radical SAM protein (TIGR01212 family)
MAALNLYNRYMLKTYGERVQKIAVDGGFTCPNRDGSRGVGGCTFCNNDSYGTKNKMPEVSDQINAGKEFYLKKFPGLNKFIVYFQSYSNTYKPLAELEKMYMDALKIEGVIGLAIGTRPDCIDKEKISFLEQLAKSYDITIEYGVESLIDSTLVRINRGHTVREFKEAISMTYGRGIKMCTHLILGFPWETDEDLDFTARTMATYPLDFIKIHQLQVVTDTIMGNEYKKSPFPVVNKEEYFRMLAKIVTHLSPEMVVQRMFSQYQKEYLLSPPWTETLSQLNSEFINYLDKRELFQGMHFQK